MKYPTTAFVAVFCTALPAFAAASKAGGEAAVRPLVQANNQFAISFYQKVSGRPGNMFFSPYSISSGLALSTVGAKGRTLTEMTATMGWAGTRPDVMHPLFNKLNQSLAATAKNCQLSLANGVWVQQGEPLKQSFVDAAHKHYSAEVTEVDFSHDADSSRKVVNNWIEKQTQGKIASMVAPGTVDNQTTLVLANAVYFAGKWATEFKTDLTTDQDFYARPGHNFTVPMMQQTTYFRYTATATVQVLELPYRNVPLSMIILLPKAKEGLGLVESTLSVTALNELLSGLKKTAVEVYLPRFKMTTDYDLIPPLRELGIKRAFTPEGDFSGIRNGPLFMNFAMHRAALEVDEQGTEAAAATVVALAKDGGRHPEPFHADHPFMFLIRDSRSGAILFMGRLSDPG